MASMNVANSNISMADMILGYDPSGHHGMVVFRLLNITTDTTVTPNVLYGDLAVSIPGGVGFVSDYPVGAIPVMATSGVKANAVATATLPGAANLTTYISGFDVTRAGATVGLSVTVTASNLSSALSWIYTATVGALLANSPLLIRFDHPLPATAQNTAIAVSCPALGLGNLNNIVNAYGYQL